MRKSSYFAFSLTSVELILESVQTELDIATGLWEMMIPLDPDSEFSKEHLQWWTDFLVSKGSKSVSKDTWNLVSLRLVSLPLL